jgi:hypothetical protein
LNRADRIITSAVGKVAISRSAEKGIHGVRSNCGNGMPRGPAARIPAADAPGLGPEAGPEQAV